MRPATLAAGLLAAAACAAAAGCGPAPPPFRPAGAPVTAAAQPRAPGPDGVTTPPFGPDAHIVMTGWLPGQPGLARAVLTDKDYELAYLYAEYTGGRDQGWTAYVNAVMAAEIRGALSARAVTTESFRGTIRIFGMSAARDPVLHADVDVSACFDNAQAVNTSLATGAVLPGQQPSDGNYYRYTDELAPAPSGQWQVIASFQHVAYPRAKECKP